MKKILALILSLLIVFGSFAACNKTSDMPSIDDDTADISGTNGDTDNSDIIDTPDSSNDPAPDKSDDQTGDTDEGEGEADEDIKENEGSKTNMLDGKKVIFIGNSHTYYGKTVLEKKQSVLTQEARSNDMGYFYQICKNNGAEVAVTNWTFGNHTFTDLFEECSADRGCNGVDHFSYLTDLSFDYVIMQQGTSDISTDAFIDKCNMVMGVFRDANPDVKFVFLVARRVHEKNLKWLSGLKALDEQGVTIVDWGRLVDDVIKGKAEVPGATLKYNQNSFIVCKSASDGYHPNMLTGYITSLMTYCAITGESAEGQDYSFCGKYRLNREFNFSNFISSYYTYNGATTNFTEIFGSESDMKGIQQLIDRYLEEKAYMNY